MAEKMSTGLCVNLMDTGSFRSVFDGTTAEIRIYQGTVPATADLNPATPTPIATVKEAGAALNFAAAPSALGVIAKGATAWTDPSIAATATATFYRLVLNADTNNNSATAKRIQGTIGTANTFDMIVGNAALTSGATFTVNTFTQTMAPS